MQNHQYLLFILFAVCIFNCSSNEISNPTLIERKKQENYLTSIIYWVIEDTQGLKEELNSPEIQSCQAKMKIIESRPIDKVNVAKTQNLLIRWLIHTINSQNRIEFVPNRLFKSLIRAIKNIKNQQFYPSNISEVTDLESVFKLMLLNMQKDYKLLPNEFLSVFQNNLDKSNPNYQDELIKKCILKCKKHKLPGKYFFDKLLESILKMDSIKNDLKLFQ